MHYELCINVGVPAVAVGLSAISFSAALQKDAASIPNALEAEVIFSTFNFQLSIFNFVLIASSIIFVAIPQS